MIRHTQRVPAPRLSPSPPTPASSSPGWTATQIRDLVDGAAYLFTNEYEAALTEQKTGWTAEEVLERVGVRVTTLGKDGAPDRAQGRGRRSWSAAPDEERKADPTGRRRRASGPASSPGWPGASGTSARRRSARCWRPTSSRPWAPRSTRCAQQRFLERVAKAYGDEAVERHRAARGLPASLSAPMNDEDLIGVGLDLRPETLRQGLRDRHLPHAARRTARAARLVVAEPSRDPPARGAAGVEVAAPVLPSLHSHPRPGLRRRPGRVRQPRTDPTPGSARTS